MKLNSKMFPEAKIETIVDGPHKFIYLKWGKHVLHTDTKMVTELIRFVMKIIDKRDIPVLTEKLNVLEDA